MTDKSANWMDQAGGLFKLWSEQQQDAFRTFTASAGPYGNAGGPIANAPLSMSEGLRQAQELWQSSMAQWVTLAQQALPASGVTGDALKMLFDPSRWTQAGLGPLDAAIEHLVEGPSYATLWTLDRKLLKAQKLRAEWAKDLVAYQFHMQAAWNEAVKRFLSEINDAQGTPITNWRELTDVWIKVANDSLTETHRTPEFLEAQRRLTRSGAECRLQEREIAEAFCEMQQTPTRTEMDEVQREVYELRRQLRALQKMSAAAATPKVSQPKSTNKPRRRSKRATPDTTP
jgi:polyhydroxyalkanoate synthesis regulator phasin